MKTILVFLTILSLSLCGHIYVDDLQLKWQNKGELNQITVRFSLQSGLGKSDVFRIGLPFTWANPSTAVLAQGGSTLSSKGATSGPVVATSITGANIFASFGVALSANVWYSLTIAGAVASVDEKCYESPVTLQTQSTSAANAIVYDENLSAGQICVSEEVSVLKSLQVSLSKTKLAEPKSLDANNALEAVYTVYIDIQTTKDYLGGAFIRYEITNSFTFNGNCASESNTCVASGATGFDATCVNVTTADTGSCTAELVNGVATGNYIQEHVGALRQNTWRRIKIDIKNPSFYASAANTGTVRVYLYSRVRDVFYYYEKKVDLAAQFQINQITIENLAVLFFWGIAASEATTFGCPVALYRDSDVTGNQGATQVLKIWNKVQVHFAVKASFPSLSSATYTVTVYVNQATGVALGSINTNLPKKDTAKSLASTCSAASLGASATISCSNIGAPTVATYWFVASINIKNDVSATSVSNFGKVEISSQRIESTGSLTAAQVSSTGSNGQSVNIRKNDEYTKGLEAANLIPRIGTGPQVITFTAATPTQAYTPAGLKGILAQHIVTADQPEGASDILIPTTGTIDLLFIISAQQDQLCCLKKTGDSSTSHSCPTTAAVATCQVATAGAKAQTLLKVFANPNAFTTTETLLNNGVRVLNWGLFNNLADTATAGPCVRTKFCGTYDTAAANNTLAFQTTNKWYNIWQVKTSAAVNGIVPESILHLTFLCGDVTAVDVTDATTKAATQICAQSATIVYSTTDADNRLPGFIWHGVTIASGFLGNPLYPSKFELDFIVCFRYEAGAANKTNHAFVIETAEQNLASSGVIHATAYHKGYDVATSFRINVFNVARTATAANMNDFSVVPMFLRVGGNIAGSDWKANTGAAVFFDQYIEIEASTTPRLIQQAYFSTCASSTDAAIICEESHSSDINDNFYYYPIQRRIVLRSTISSATEFNHYVPAQLKAFTFKSLSLVLVNADSVGGNYLTQRAFKIFGYVQQKAITLYYGSAAAIGADPAATPSFISTSTGADNNADANVYALRTLGVTQTAVNGVSDHPQKSCVLTALILQSSGTAVNPLWGGFSLATGTYDVNAQITACAVAAAQNPVPTAGTANDGLTRINNARWGAHFQVTATQIKFWTGSKLTWDLSQATQPKSDCLEYTYKTKADTARFRYVIICPADQGTEVKAPTVQRLLKFDKFTVPFYVGGASAGGVTTDGQKVLLGYVWSDSYGAVKGYQPQAGNTRGQDATSGTACTQTAYTSIWVPSGNAQRVTFSVKLTQNILLNQAFKSVKIIPDLNQASALSPAYINTFCYANWANVDCALDSATALSPIFTLTSTNAATTFENAYTGDTSINFWISTGAGTDTTTTYKVRVLATNPAASGAGTEQLVNHCETAAAWQAGTTAYGATVTSISSTFPLFKKVQGTISVKWTINKPLYSFQGFKLTLGFLGLAQASVQGKNAKCNLYSGDNYDFDYETSTAETTLDTVSIALRNDKAIQYAYSTKSSFEFRCHGAFSPENAIVAADNIRVDWQQTAGSATNVAFGFDTGFKTGLTTAADRTALETLAVPTLDAQTAVTFTTTVARTWNDLGQEADYTFTTVISGNYTVDAGTWVVVEFTRAIAPRLNRRGIIHCDTGFNTTLARAYCEFVGDRRVRFLVNQRLLNATLNPAGYKFVVRQVRLPAAYIQSYDQIYWALYDKNQATLLKHAWLKDATIGTQAPGPLKVLEYSVSTNLTRNTATINFLVQIPTGLVKADQELFVLFPGEYNDAFYKGFTPQCTLNRQLDDWSGQGSDNYIKNCSYQDGLRVRAYLNLDSANAAAAKAYRLSISGVPTPHDPSPGWSAPQIQIPNIGTTTVARQSCAGYSNASYHGFGADSTKNYIEWQNSQVSARVGVYSGSAAFVPPTGKKSFTEDITLTTSTSAFSFSPATFVVTGGSKISSFRFAPKSTTSPGLQFIDFATGNNNYAPLKPLQVQVLALQCEIENDASYSFPHGAASLPYVISFENCQPETSVVLKVSALNSTASSLDNLGKGFDSRNFTIDSTGTAASFEVRFGGVQQISFQLRSTDQTTSVSSTVGKLVFSWESSPNQNSYSIKNPIATVSSTLPDVLSSQLTLAANPAAGQVTLAYTCDKAAVFYYAIGTNNGTLTSLTYTAIKAETLDKGISQTWPDAANDQVHGYAIARTGNTQQSVVVQRVRSLAAYYAVGICVNPSNNITAGSTKYTNWTQTDNNGRPSTVNITFSDSLSSSQEQSTCTALAVATATSCNMTVCPNQNNACGTSAYSTTSSTAAPSTNTTSNTTNTTNSTSGAKRRRILQNTTNTTNTTTQNIQNCTSYQGSICLACNGTLLLALGGGSCLTACPSGQVASAGKCIVSTKKSYYYAILPNPYVASDTTFADVQSALADKASFNTVFRARAALGNLTYEDPQLLDQITGTLQRPVLTVNLTAPSAYADFPNVTFSARINGTDGWIFLAIADGQSLTKPTLEALRANTNKFRLRQQFVKNGQTYQGSVTLVNTTLNYTAFYAATNQDPVRGLGTEVQSTEFKIVEGTVEVPDFGSNISVGILAMLALIFALFIMI